MLDLGSANGAVQVDQFVNALDILCVRHSAFAVGQALSAKIAVFFVPIADLAFAFVRVAVHMRFMSVGRVMMRQLMLAVVVRFFGSMVMVVTMFMAVVVVMPVVMSMVVPMVVIVSVVMFVIMVVIMDVLVIV
jgi:hypothetical protein